MDPVTLVFYAVVCALLGLAGPRLGRPAIRFVLGAGVGVAAAAILPVLRVALGL